MRARRVLVSVLAVVVTALCASVVVGQAFAFGPVLVSVSQSHGLHLSDVPVLGLRAVSMVVCGALWSRPSD